MQGKGVQGRDWEGMGGRERWWKGEREGAMEGVSVRRKACDESGMAGFDVRGRMRTGEMTYHMHSPPAMQAPWRPQSLSLSHRNAGSSSWRCWGGSLRLGTSTGCGEEADASSVCWCS